MKVAIDLSSITGHSKDAHKVRGIGSYTRGLLFSLKLYAPQHEIVGFNSPADIPNDADIAHYTYFDPFFLSLPFTKKTKTVITVHDFIPLLFPDHFPAGIKGTLRWQIQRFLLRKMDGIISVSECTTKDCMSLTNTPQSKIRTIYSAGADIFAEPLSQSDLTRIKKHYNLPQRFILYVGDATWNKNLPRLLKAATLSKIPLVMAGKALVQEFDQSNSWNSDLVEISALTEESSFFRKLGYVPQKDLVGLYSLALTLVMPSLYEGFGFPILEAMMAGCPVITAKKGAIPEIASDAALYVDPMDVASIAEGINKFAQNGGKRNEYIKMGAVQASKFTWKKTAEQTASYYQEIYGR
ncbi:MAG: glycosyltransferase family 4 protein [Candidatus Levybacteria bacterium]|nr:glycosyltransferase family 4 protein [Candidatus Levybacteria bacterium]